MVRKYVNIFVSYIFPLIVIAYILYKVTPERIIHTLREVTFVWLLIGFSLYVINYFFRSLRFKTLIHSKNIGLKDIFQVSCFHSMYNYILPARTGEFSYVYYLKRITNTPVIEGLSTLLVARLLDLITVFLFLPLVLFFLRQRISDDFIQLAVIFAGTVLFISMFFFYFVVSGQRTMKICDRCLRKFDFARLSIWKRFREKLGEFHNSFVMIHKKRIYSRVFIFTLLVWLSVYGHFYFIIRALRVEINFWQVILLLMIMVPTRLLPVQGIGNLGTHEIGWVIAFRIFQFQQDEALLVAFNSHIILFIYVIILGGYAILSTRDTFRKEDHVTVQS